MPLENVLKGADPYNEAMKDLEAKPPPDDLECAYCNGLMKIAWFAPSDPKDTRGNIMVCKECRASCQAIGDKNWDWRKV